MANTSYPLLYQVDTRVWLNELSCHLGRPATLDDIADIELGLLAELGGPLGLAAECVAYRGS